MNDGTVSSLDAARTAVILMDYENGVLATVADAVALIDRVARALAVVRGTAARVVHVRVALTAADVATMPAANLMFAGIAAGGLFADGTDATAFPLALTPRAGETVVRKARVGALRTTSLLDTLRADSIDTLVLAGIHTGGVVLSTLRDAADLDFRLYVVEDLCADPNAAVHRCLFDHVFPRQASVIVAADLATLLG